MSTLDNDELDLILKELENATRSLETPRIKLLNPVVYQKMLRAATILELFAAEADGCGEVEVKVKPALHLGEVRLEIPFLETLPMRLIHEIVDDADECEVYEISGGKQRLCVTFHCLFTAM